MVRLGQHAERNCLSRMAGIGSQRFGSGRAGAAGYGSIGRGEPSLGRQDPVGKISGEARSVYADSSVEHCSVAKRFALSRAIRDSLRNLQGPELVAHQVDRHRSNVASNTDVDQPPSRNGSEVAGGDQAEPSRLQTETITFGIRFGSGSRLAGGRTGPIGFGDQLQPSHRRLRFQHQTPTDDTRTNGGDVDRHGQG